MPNYDYRKTAAYKARTASMKFVPKKSTKRAQWKPKRRKFPIEELTKRKGLVARTCPTCHVEFAVYACTIKNKKSGKLRVETFCSDECFKKGKTVEKRMNEKMAKKSLSTVKKILKKSSFYKHHKEEFKDKIIPFKESPTGKAYVGINKEPFMRAADNGHGYQGVLIQDENRLVVQCHSCGKWMQRNTANHIQACAGISMDAYKEKYGLNKGEGLVSDETSLRLTKAALKNKDPQAKMEMMRKATGNRGKGTKTYTMAFYNKYGTCPIQLQTRLYEFIRCNRELPGQGNRGRPIYKALVRRYGSFGHALTAHGLPFMKRQGTTLRFFFADGTHFKYNLNQFKDREGLYNMIMEKCPVLSPSL